MTRVVAGVTEATVNVRAAARSEGTDVVPPMWPARPILDLCVLVVALTERVDALEKRVALNDRVDALEERVAEVAAFAGNHAHDSLGHAHEPI
jgi:hypothetical protein